MQKVIGSVVSTVALLVLFGCDSCKNSSSRCDSSGNMVIEDAELQGSAADFITNAGDRVFYAYDSSSISAESEETLIRQAQWLQTHPDRRVLIEGHCDERGTREYNIGLGERRADAAARYLINKGIDGSRVRTISYGKDRPIAAEGSKEDIYRMNRVAIAVIE